MDNIFWIIAFVALFVLIVRSRKSNKKNLQHFKVFLGLIEIFSELFLNFSILNSTFLGGLSMIFLGILMLVFSLWGNFFLRLA